MRRWNMRLGWLPLMALCLLLTSCRKDAPAAPADPLSPAPVLDPIQIPAAPAAQPLVLDRLAVEIVVDWGDVDRILSSLDELSRLLGEALEERACLIDEVAVTIGTAGGITAQALCDGGVDAAFLPDAAFAELEEGTAMAVLKSPERGLIMAVAAAEALEEQFFSILPEALAATEAGQGFLDICYPGAAFTVAG